MSNSPLPGHTSRRGTNRTTPGEGNWNEAGAILMTQHDETAIRIVPTLSRLSLKAFRPEVESNQGAHENILHYEEVGAGALAQFFTIGLTSKDCFEMVGRLRTGVPRASRFELQRYRYRGGLGKNYSLGNIHLGKS